MKFLHVADCHLGGWRDDKLSEVGLTSFKYAIDKGVEENVDFILIAGDLFNTSLPSIDVLKKVTTILADVKKSEIPIYIICGSHDFSPSGKTMVDVLENAGLVINPVSGKWVDDKLVLEFTEDKSGAKITGMLGKKAMLEKSIYEQLDVKPLEAENGFKIFMLHTALTELKPEDLKEMESMALSYLPKGFDYYAAGHVHYRFTEKVEDRMVVYPGPTFPNNFKELWDLTYGSYVLYNEGEITVNDIKLHDVERVTIDAKNRDPAYVESQLSEFIAGTDLKDKIILIRIAGTLSTGRPTDVGFAQLTEFMYEKGAFSVLRNTAKFTSKEFENIKIDADRSSDEIEAQLIDEHVKDMKLDVPDKKAYVTNLMNMLSTERPEGMKVKDFEEKIRKEFVDLSN